MHAVRVPVDFGPVVDVAPPAAAVVEVEVVVDLLLEHAATTSNATSATAADFVQRVI
jgi:hypothetical protein